MGSGTPKLKSENYTNFGGMNEKTSQYITSQNEFLVLKNLDASVVGSLTKTWGSTNYGSGQGASLQITGIGEVFSLLSTFTYFGVGGESFLFGQTNTVLTTSLQNVFRVAETGFTNIYTYLFSLGASGGLIDYPFDFLTADKLYFANGSEFDTYNPQSATIMPYSLPAPAGPGGALRVGVGSSNAQSIDLNATYSFWFRFIRADGFLGPLAFTSTQIPTFTGQTNRASFRYGVVPALPGWVYGGNSVAAMTYSYFGISGLIGWVSPNDGASVYNYEGILTPGLVTYIISASYVGFHGTYILDVNDQFNGSFYYPNNVEPFPVTLPSITVNPSCLELFNNQLFMAGFINNPTYNPSTVVYSNIGDFEKIDPENFFEVRTDDGDMVSSLKAYFTELVIFKYKTTWSLRGDNPDNFNLSEATGIYGCVSNNANCVWEQRLWFLDQKGICEYNGANTKIVSNKVQPTFQRMNQTAARKVASMIHAKERNEVWCFIPTDDNSFCDTCVVYDYLADFWYVKDNLRETSMAAMIQGSYNVPKPFIGGKSGLLYAYDSQYLTDDQFGMTCVAKTRYISTELGHSQQKVFRRLFLDCDVEGASIPIQINFYSNQGTQVVFSASMILSQFQNRFDMGISAKDLSIEFIYSSDSPLRINGFTLEYRFQRAV